MSPTAHSKPDDALLLLEDLPSNFAGKTKTWATQRDPHPLPSRPAATRPIAPVNTSSVSALDTPPLSGRTTTSDTDDE